MGLLGWMKARIGVRPRRANRSPDKGRVHKQPDWAVILPPPGPPRSPEQTIAAAVMVGDEVAYIREWVAFHLSVGFERLDIYVNWLDRLEPTHHEVADFVAAGSVTITPWPNVFTTTHTNSIAATQCHCYAHAIAVHRGRTRWLALIDADEFLYSPVEDDLRAVFRRFEDRPAIAIPWVNFGSSGHATRPDGLVIDAYTSAATDDCILNRQYKSVVQPHRITGVFNPHRFLTDEPGVCAYTEAGETLGNWKYELNRPARQILRLNHYYVKSEAEFDDRLARGWASLSPHIRERKLRDRQRVEAATVEDHGIRRFSERTRALMATGPRAEMATHAT